MSHFYSPPPEKLNLLIKNKKYASHSEYLEAQRQQQRERRGTLIPQEKVGRPKNNDELFVKYITELQTQLIDKDNIINNLKQEIKSLNEKIKQISIHKDVYDNKASVKTLINEICPIEIYTPKHNIVLCDDILVYIFLFINETNEILQLSLVCKPFYRIIYCNSIWQTLLLQHFYINYNDDLKQYSAISIYKFNYILDNLVYSNIRKSPICHTIKYSNPDDIETSNTLFVHLEINNKWIISNVDRDIYITLDLYDQNVLYLNNLFLRLSCNKCPKCSCSVIKRIVKKDTSNKGKNFYSCKECNFFMWFDDKILRLINKF